MPSPASPTNGPSTLWPACSVSTCAGGVGVDDTTEITASNGWRYVGSFEILMDFLYVSSPRCIVLPCFPKPSGSQDRLAQWRARNVGSGS